MKKTPTSVKDLKKMMAMDPDELIPMPSASGRPVQVSRHDNNQKGTHRVAQAPNKPCPRKTAKAKAERKRKKAHRRKNR